MEKAEKAISARWAVEEKEPAVVVIINIALLSREKRAGSISACVCFCVEQRYRKTKTLGYSTPIVAKSVSSSTSESSLKVLSGLLDVHSGADRLTIAEPP